MIRHAHQLRLQLRAQELHAKSHRRPINYDLPSYLTRGLAVSSISYNAIWKLHISSHCSICDTLGTHRFSLVSRMVFFLSKQLVKPVFSVAVKNRCASKRNVLINTGLRSELVIRFLFYHLNYVYMIWHHPVFNSEVSTLNSFVTMGISATFCLFYHFLLWIIW